MRTIARVAILLLLVSLIVVGQGTGNLTGKVVDLTGAGIPARIQLTAESGTHEKTGAAADAWGEFSFTGLRATTYTVECYLPGFRSMTVKGVTIEDQNTTSLPPFVLQIGQLGCGRPKPVEYFRILEGQAKIGSISGRVQIDEGPMKGSTPAVVGATVKILCSKGGLCGETTTDQRGEFSFSGIYPGNASLQITAKGYYPFEEVGLSVDAGWERSYYPFYLDRCLNKSCAPVKPKKWKVIACE